MAGGNLRKIAGIAAAAASASAKAKSGPKTGAPASPPAAGPSPDPKTNLVLADIALRGGGLLLRRGVERGILGASRSPETARAIVKGRSLAGTLAGAALARIATTSVPGAILVGGGLLAKTLYDRRKSRAQAQADGETDLQDTAKRGGKG